VSRGPGGLELAEALGHQEVRLVHDPATGLRAVVAIHDTTLGPAVGGTRMRVYPSLHAALTDALRLSRAMTAKAAMAEMPYGGGKAVILGDPARDKTEALLTAYAAVLRDLQDRFHSGCDLGLDAKDVAFLARLAPNISDASGGASLDTAGLAALGVFASIEAAAERLGAPVRALHVAVQGVGAVGGALARRLAEAGARLTLADLDDARVRALAAELGAAVAATGEIDAVESDVFSPNAAGGVLDERTVARLRCRAVVGGANEQLEESRDGDALHARGILYAPDYVVNAGGLLSLLFETGQCDEQEVTARVRAIGPRLLSLWERAAEAGRPPHRVADEWVAARLRAARGQER
jgi:leucine dehydrogenase